MSDVSIEVTLGKEGGKTTFRSLDGVLEWLKHEQEFWNWLRGESLGKLNSALGGIRGALTSAEEFQKKPVLKGSSEVVVQQTLEGHAKAIADSFARAYDKDNVIVSTSPRGVFLSELNKIDGPIVANAACCFFFNQPLTLNLGGFGSRTDLQPLVLRGMLKAWCFERGITDPTPYSKEIFGDFLTECRQQFDTFHTKLMVEGEKHEKLTVSCENQLAEQNTKFNELNARAQKEWDDWKKALRVEMKWKASVGYWTKKKWWNLVAAIVFAILALIAGTALYVYGLPELEKLLTPSPGVKASDNWRPPYSQLAVVVVLGSLGVWLIRVVLRLFFCYLHLHNDARERETMVQTYLALLSEGKAPEDEDRRLIVQTLFRQASTGFLKEDKVPHAIVNRLTGF